MKKIFSIFILIAIIYSSTIIKVSATGEDCSAFTSKILYPLFRERVKCLCDWYKPENELKVIEDEYEAVESIYVLADLKLKYKTDMNDLYKCALLSSQKKALLLIKDDLIKVNADLLDRLAPVIDEKIMVIDLTMSKLECKDNSEKNSILKQDVLDQTTYETCKYVNYLEYLKEHNEYVKANVLNEDAEYSMKVLFWEKAKKINRLDKEIENTYNVFPVVFHAYTEYENNIIIHFLLDLLKEDYLVFRDKIHLVLNPLNQVIYKISNAMRLE